jgi:hypothetical protein
MKARRGIQRAPSCYTLLPRLGPVCVFNRRHASCFSVSTCLVPYVLYKGHVSNISANRTPPSPTRSFPVSNIRLFSARACPFAHRTRLVLAHKRVAFELVEIDLQNKPAWFDSRVSGYGKVPHRRSSTSRSIPGSSAGQGSRTTAAFKSLPSTNACCAGSTLRASSKPSARMRTRRTSTCSATHPSQPRHVTP